MFSLSDQNVPTHTLARVNFPPYIVKSLTERHILVAGGGGEARTGVVNSIEIYELSKCKNSNTCRARRIAHYDTDNRAIMNAIVFQKNDYFVLASGGRNGFCQIYKIKFKIEDDEFDNQNIDIPVNLSFEISRITDFQADFDTIKEPYLKAIKYSSNAKLIATGGSDGYIRLFGYPDLKLITALPAHKDEITSLSIDSTGFRMISISRDRHAFIWNLRERSKLKELKLNLNNRMNGKLIEYDFRDCSFGTAPNDPKQSFLFTVHNPFVRMKPPCKSIICRWNTKSFEPDCIVYAGLEPFSQITISDDGKYIGAGLLTGSVEIYNASNLEKIYSMSNAHKLFVTGVEFLNSSFETQMLTGDQEASLLSISVDNHIVVHHLPKQNDLGPLGSSILFIITLFLVYILGFLSGL